MVMLVRKNLASLSIRTAPARRHDNDSAAKEALMKYMLLIYSDPSAGPAQGTPEAEAEFGAWMTVSAEMAQSGAMQAGAPLQGVETASTVRVRDGKRVVTDGPFAETKEVLGGYYLVDVPSLDEALDWAARLPNVGYGSIEVRPVFEIPGM
ncbi:MAG: YciI family protein [Acidimicrobiia bacterium]